MKNALWAFDPFSDFSRFDRMMDGVFSPINRSGEMERSFNPAVDIEETDGHFLISFDLPGVSKDDVKIEVNDRLLTVSGDRKFEREAGKASKHFVERFQGHFERSFTLPAGVEISKVEADYRDGVLMVGVPKAEKAKPHQISIGEQKGTSGLFTRLLGKNEKDKTSAA